MAGTKRPRQSVPVPKVHPGYRCPVHGRIGFRIVPVAGVAYCGEGDCRERAKNLIRERDLFELERALVGDEDGAMFYPGFRV